MNTINWQTKALRQMRKFSVSDGQTIRAAVRQELSDLSAAPNVQKLLSHSYGYRLRVGRYRVFFEFDGAIRIVSIQE
ncbi:MAG: type II toxin-antitoxin system RelE/ParE family toxin [Giesbergeria sp.]|nr:type II toxin-antitoxin system RelE/ParE family toxin [Giesbergeria sp.]